MLTLDRSDSGLLSKAPPFATLAAILRASTAFEFASMKAWAVSSLESMWPNDLKSVTPMAKTYASETLQLARECDVTNVLKRVLYEIVRMGGFGLHTVEDEIKDEDEDSEGDDEEEEEEEADDEDDRIKIEADEETENAADLEEIKSIDKGNTPSSNDKEGKEQNPLSADDLRMLIIARERLVSEWVLQAACAPKRMCQNVEAHKDDAFLWAKLVHSRGLFEENMYDPLVSLGALANLTFSDEPYENEGDLGVLWVNWEENWCPECTPRMEETFEKARTKIWEKLDIWFGLK